MIKFYEVGGAVRDEFLGKKAKDIDFSVEAPSYIEMIEFIKEHGGKIYLERPEFLTVRAKYLGVDADFVMCRKDGFYSDGRRPDNVIPGTIYDDLARRDFTINAIAINMENGEFLDPHNGIKDIKNGRIRAVGNTDERFYEDELRLLRAIRFHITLDFVMSDDIIKCLRNIKHINRLINTVSFDRIRDEMSKIFKHDSYQALNIFETYPLLKGACFKNGLWLKPTVEL